MKHKITFILLSLFLLNSTVGYSYQGEVFTLSSLTATEKKSAKAIWKTITPTGNGTGFFISKNEFVTNFHIIDHLTQDNIKSSHLIQEGHSRTLKIKQIKHLSAQHDLAVLEIEGEVNDYLNISEEIPQPDEDLFLIGYPDGQFSVIKKVSNILLSRNESSYSFFSDHSTLSGASGSPLLNLKGEVVGVLHASNVNLVNATKAIHLKSLLSEEIKSFENPENHVAHAIEQLKKAGEQGDAGAQFKLGTFYHQGIGVEQGYNQAFKWYQKAAEQGYAEAQYYLGGFYYFGQGVEQDYDEAFNWVEKAANQGHVEAKIQLERLRSRI